MGGIKITFTKNNTINNDTFANFYLMNIELLILDCNLTSLYVNTPHLEKHEAL